MNDIAGQDIGREIVHEQSPDTLVERMAHDKIGEKIKEWISKFHDELMAQLSDLKTEIANAEHLLDLKKLEVHTSVDGQVTAAQGVLQSIEDIRARLAGVHKAIGGRT